MQSFFKITSTSCFLHPFFAIENPKRNLSKTYKKALLKVYVTLPLFSVTWSNAVPVE